MNGMPPHNGPMAIAKESIAMSKETGDRTFKVMALVLMAASGLATLLHAGHAIFRDLTAGRGRRGPVHEEGPPERPARPHVDMPEHDAGPGHRASWVHKARVAERPAGPQRAWAETVARHGRSREH